MTTWVGRERELAAVRAAVDTLARGRGSVVWVEGDAGIGKSSLIAAGIRPVQEIGGEVLWGTADPLSQRFPLQVMLDCLQIRPRSADPRRAEIAKFLRDRRLGLLATDDVLYTAVEMLVSLVDELCAVAPTTVVVDDLQWADEASLAMWHRLALTVDQLPLLLVGACRPVARRQDIRESRAAVHRRGGTVITLGPLADAEVAELAAGLAGDSPIPELAEIAAQTRGNPFFLRELVDAHLRGQASRSPASLATTLNDRLAGLPAETADMLRTASLLGGEFTVTDLAALSRRQPSELAASVRDAVEAGIVVDGGRRLAFGHPLIQQALYGSMPQALRTALHLEAAAALAAAETEPTRVAQQLLAADQPGVAWARAWLLEATPALAARAPEIAAELLRRELDHSSTSAADLTALSTGLARTLLALGRDAEAAARARQALAVAGESGEKAEMSWVLARALFSTGDNDAAVDAVRQALAQPVLPEVWRARLLASLAMFERAGTGDLRAADDTARQALSAAERAGDAFSTAYALTDLWMTHSVRRDHLGALGHVDRALEVLGTGAEHTDLRAYALDARIFTMQNLDRWQEAEQSLRDARELAWRTGGSGPVSSALTAAVLLYWLGRWDDALTELMSVESDATALTYSGLRERGPVLLWHGLAAMIAGRRDQAAVAREHLRAGLDLPIVTVSDRENRDFLIAAHALAVEREGDPARALRILSGLLDRRAGEMTLIHQWLPDLVRLATTVDNAAVASAALRASQFEAKAESTPARAAAASQRCRGLAGQDPAPLREAVEYYRRVGPPVDLAGALEDLAAVLAARGQAAEAKTALDEAIDRYQGLDAGWNIRRATTRLRQLGVRRGVRGRRPVRATSGWEALTPTELRIAGLVANGRSTPDIGQDLYLSRRTVQTHISHILAKLGVRSRVEIAREALRRETTVR
ncbi:AAA family ATPase [Actinomycetes bacterium KLBMP 9797]